MTLRGQPELHFTIALPPDVETRQRPATLAAPSNLPPARESKALAQAGPIAAMRASPCPSPPQIVGHPAKGVAAAEQPAVKTRRFLLVKRAAAGSVWHKAPATTRGPPDRRAGSSAPPCLRRVRDPLKAGLRLAEGPGATRCLRPPS